MKSVTNSNSLIYILVAIMPLHVFIFNLVDNRILALWRDLVLIFLVLVILITRYGKIRLDNISKCIFIASIFCLVHALLFHDPKMSVGIWGNTLRVYLMPFYVYIIVINLRLKKSDVLSLKKIYVYESIAINLFGIIQQLFIGTSFIKFMGYRRASITFATGLQRNIGLFDSANIMAIYLIFSLILAWEIKDDIRGKKFILSSLMIGFILTFSFTGYIVLFAVLFLHILLVSKNTGAILIRIIKYVILTALIILSGVIVDKLFFNSFVFVQVSRRVIDFFSALYSDNLYSMTTSSAAVHLLSITKPISVLKDNFWGMGFSVGTFMVLGRVDVLTYAVESSVFTILYDFGIISGMMYLLPFLKLLFAKMNTKTNAAISVKLLLFSILFYFISLPIVQSYELRFFVFFFAGVGYISRRENFDDRGILE